ncbi:MAG TPA: Uma2 family endonuclease [Bryobacteraceae bacterium]|nr:Uma2 family endonuclease [Bryobacteraceae bacterium]
MDTRAMATSTRTLLTVDEYSRVPPPPDGRWELRRGELVKVTYPRGRHTKAQMQLVALLTPRTRAFGKVGQEFPFTPREAELRSADVAIISHARWATYDPESYFSGAPDIVIEVLSPSNTVDEIADKEALCLATGAREFWLVNPKLRTVRVSTPDKHSITYESGESVPLPLLPGAEPLPVAEIFADEPGH